MIDENSQTYFAAAERVDFETILEQHALVKNTVELTLFDGFPEIALILNAHRQIILYNESVRVMFDGVPDTEILGSRPGELFHCVNAISAPGGCGTSVECKECGAILAVLNSTGGESRQEQCKLLVSSGKGIAALEISIKAIPLSVAGQAFTLVFMKDIGSELRRSSLERLFFHDINNVISGLLGVADLLHEELPRGFEEYTDIMKERVEFLHHEIESYRRLVLAEYGQLNLDIERVLLLPFIDTVARFFRGASFAGGKVVTVSTDAIEEEAALWTDKGLFQRVALNLLKNALEASSEGDSVAIGLSRYEGGIRLTVSNNQYMNAHVRSQVFHRSFSTKSKDRGLGTYSAKLFTENYLCGHLDFTSVKETGTTFIVTLPDLEHMLES